MNTETFTKSPHNELWSNTDTDFWRELNLLDAIRSLKAGVGDSLNDKEFTLLVKHMALAEEAGFEFLSFCEGCVTFAVPPQNLSDWHPAHGWITPEKESLAHKIADKYGLEVHEPPDITSGYIASEPAKVHMHHHLEFGTQQESIIVAHPLFLKIRVYAGSSAILLANASRNGRLLSPDLLRDFSLLYH